MTDPVNPEVVTPSRRAEASGQIRRLIAAIRQGDDALVQDTVTQLGARHRYLAPLGMVVGAFAMLFEGLRLVVTNWRLTLVQILPAMWIWVAMVDLKAHALHGKSFHVLRGPILIPIVLLIAAVTAAAFYLNGVFAFAIAKPGQPEIRPAFAEARGHLPIVLGSGFVVGLLLGVATTVFPRWGTIWFTLSLSIVVGVMMVLYVSLPSRLIGMKSTYSKRDALKATAVGGALGAAVCSPPYAIGRIGILMLGSHTLFIPGLFVLAFGVVLQTGATSSVKAIKMSAKLVAGNHPPPSEIATSNGPQEAPIR